MRRSPIRSRSLLPRPPDLPAEAMTPERVKEGLLDVALELEKKQERPSPNAGDQAVRRAAPRSRTDPRRSAIRRSLKRTRCPGRSSSAAIRTRRTPAQWAAWRSAWERRRSSTPGSPRTCGSQVPETVKSGDRRASPSQRDGQGLHAGDPPAPICEERPRHRQDRRILRRCCRRAVRSTSAPR